MRRYSTIMLATVVAASCSKLPTAPTPAPDLSLATACPSGFAPNVASLFFAWEHVGGEVDRYVLYEAFEPDFALDSASAVMSVPPAVIEDGQQVLYNRLIDVIPIYFRVAAMNGDAVLSVSNTVILDYNPCA